MTTKGQKKAIAAPILSPRKYSRYAASGHAIHFILTRNAPQYAMAGTTTLYRMKMAQKMFATIAAVATICHGHTSIRRGAIGWEINIGQLPHSTARSQHHIRFSWSDCAAGFHIFRSGLIVHLCAQPDASQGIARFPSVGTGMSASADYEQSDLERRFVWYRRDDAVPAQIGEFVRRNAHVCCDAPLGQPVLDLWFG